MDNLDLFFKQFNIKPNNREIYVNAFTHSSFNVDLNNSHRDYQRLEFIGDSFLGFIVASLVYKLHPELEEGYMTKVRAYLVQTKSLYSKALEKGYEKYVRAGNSLTLEQVTQSKHILEDIFEAVIGAVYIDQGFEFASKFVSNFFYDDVKNFDFSNINDYKSILQEAMQAEFRESVVYNVVSEKGPPNDRTFVIEAVYNGQVLGYGTGKSKKDAEQLAAKEALSKVAK